MYGDHVQSFVWRWAKEWQKEEDWTLMSVVGNAMNHVYCLKNEWNASRLQLVRWFMHKKKPLQHKDFCVRGASLLSSHNPHVLCRVRHCSLSLPLLPFPPEHVQVLFYFVASCCAPAQTSSTWHCLHKCPFFPSMLPPHPRNQSFFLTTGPHTFMATVGRRFFYILRVYMLTGQVLDITVVLMSGQRCGALWRTGVGA